MALLPCKMLSNIIFFTYFFFIFFRYFKCIHRHSIQSAGVPHSSRYVSRPIRPYLSRPAAAALTSMPHARPSFSMDSTCVQGLSMS